MSIARRFLETIDPQTAESYLRALTVAKCRRKHPNHFRSKKNPKGEPCAVCWRQALNAYNKLKLAS